MVKYFVDMINSNSKFKNSISKQIPTPELILQWAAEYLLSDIWGDASWDGNAIHQWLYVTTCKASVLDVNPGYWIARNIWSVV